MKKKTVRKIKFKIFAILFLLASAIFWFETRIPTSPAYPRQKKQTLFVAVDGIPFWMIKEEFEKSQPVGFGPPRRVIATFPSTTTTAFTGLFQTLGAKSAPGYDARFFSYKLKEMRGNLLDAYDYEAADYHRFFLYNRNTGYRQVVMYTAPSYALKRDLKFIEPIIWANPEKQSIFFYLGSTDGSGHLDGPEKTKLLLRETLQAIEKIRNNYQKTFGMPLEVVLFSDHGFYWEALKAIDIDKLDKKLKEKSLILSEDLKNEKNVVAITWGNISGADFYTAATLAGDVAGTLAELDGSDLVFYRDQENQIVVVSKKDGIVQKAKIRSDESGNRFRYQMLNGDPLEYQSVIIELTNENKMDQQGFADEKDWFEKTMNHRYPDALYRVHAGFFKLAENPATILLSTQKNYEFGDALTRFGALFRGGIAGTHGDLGLDSASAFVMTTREDIQWPEVLRYDQVFLPFQKEVNP